MPRLRPKPFEPQEPVTLTASTAMVLSAARTAARAVLKAVGLKGRVAITLTGDSPKPLQGHWIQPSQVQYTEMRLYDADEIPSRSWLVVPSTAQPSS